MELDWNKYIEIAQRFQGKARFEDREDLKHGIILRLAELASNNGHKPFTEWAMLRVASYVVMEYWHAEKRNGKVVTLNARTVDSEGDSVELIDTLANDKALDLDAWLDAKIWLLSCPKRLVHIAVKKANRIALDNADLIYLCKWRKKGQESLFNGKVLAPQIHCISGSTV